MAVQTVLQLGDPRLRELCAPVPDPTAARVAAVVEDLRETLAHWRATTGYGRAIAAPQVGVLERIIFVNVDDIGPMVNPEIIDRSAETMVVWDACLSFLCIFVRVRRHQRIKVRYDDLEGDAHELEATGDLSELLQHEIDHLDGILAVDRMIDTRSMCTREEFEKRYRNQSPYRPTTSATG